MNTTILPEPPSDSLPLFDLQMRIARKADENVRERQLEGALNSHCWLLAEAEVLGRDPAITQPERAPEGILSAISQNPFARCPVPFV